MGLDTNHLSESVLRTVTARGSAAGGFRRAHSRAPGRLGEPGRLGVARAEREDAQNSLLVGGATRSVGAGNRQVPEEPDPVRTCFERDFDRVHHSTALRSLAGKQQVFLDADGALRTRLTHSTEVSQIAGAVAQAVGANEVLATAAGLAHDVGHSPCGHDGEVVFGQFIPGFDHATYGADVVLVDLNLCAETLDAVRHHSWRLAGPATPEGEIVSWADRIAYTTSDFQDAVRSGIVTPAQLPASVTDAIGGQPEQQIRAFIDALVRGTLTTGAVSMDEGTARALDDFREFNYEHIYLRPEARVQAGRARALLGQLVEYFSDRPALTGVGAHATGSDAAVRGAVRHVAGLTDRTVLGLGLTLLGWQPEALPRGA
jgi:dGTPase